MYVMKYNKYNTIKQSRYVLQCEGPRLLEGPAVVLFAAFQFFIIISNIFMLVYCSVVNWRCSMHVHSLRDY